MFQRFTAIFLAFILVLTFPVVSLAQGNDQEIPEKDGIYNVSGHPNLKVRVFVHNPKSSPSSVLSCTPNNDLDS